MGLSIHAPTPQHFAFRAAMEAAVKEHGATLDAVEILALLCHLVGQVVALQDQNRYTSTQIMELVGRNIEQGNSEALTHHLLNNTGGNA
jgi:hypothetical protein